MNLEVIQGDGWMRGSIKHLSWKTSSAASVPRKFLAFSEYLLIVPLPHIPFLE